MAWTHKNLWKMAEILKAMPENSQFDIELGGEVNFQAYTQPQVREVMKRLPGVIWMKTYRNDCGWWEYTATWNGVPLKIFACREAPPTCTARYAEVEMEKQVPITFETQKVMVRKLVGWDCVGSADKEE